MSTIKNDQISQKCWHQHMRMWPHAHASAHTKNIRDVQKKSMPCLIQRASRCAAVCMSKTTTVFIFHFLYNRKILRENDVFIYFLFRWFSSENCIILLFSSNKEWQTLKELKRKINDWTIVFLMSLLIVLTWKILLLFSFWYKIVSCFK